MSQLTQPELPHVPDRNICCHEGVFPRRERVRTFWFEARNSKRDVTEMFPRRKTCVIQVPKEPTCIAPETFPVHGSLWTTNIIHLEYSRSTRVGNNADPERVQCISHMTIAGQFGNMRAYRYSVSQRGYNVVTCGLMYHHYLAAVTCRVHNPYVSELFFNKEWPWFNASNTEFSADKLKTVRLTGMNWSGSVPADGLLLLEGSLGINDHERLELRGITISSGGLHEEEAQNELAAVYSPILHDEDNVARSEDYVRRPPWDFNQEFKA
ncbi:hypothetical protein BKA62DRAFT_672358 [Auriculariales sp. MPI-PUGE-AT-0066]|nr:hypothetical protein BKA62DRAFT_672358 [Auriculariales sp. MPI-PUGE-AT-0066]